MEMVHFLSPFLVQFYSATDKSRSNTRRGLCHSWWNASNSIWIYWSRLQPNLSTQRQRLYQPGRILDKKVN